MYKLFIALLAASVFWQIATGRARIPYRTVYRKNDPFYFWGSVWVGIGGIIILLFVRYVLHVRN